MLIAFVTGNSPLTLILLCLGAVVVFIGISARAGYVYAAIPVFLTCGIHIATGSSLMRIVSETVAVALLMELGAQLASLTVRVARESADKKTLILSEERSRIAAALHDALGHRLTSISMSLEFVDRAWGTERAHEEVRVARKSVVDGLDDMRTVVRALTPITVREDFESTLHELGRSFATTGLHIEINGRSSFTEKAEEFLLAVTQEALTNTVRHAHAHHVTITMDKDSFTFADDGIGGEITEGFGLKSLRTRAANIGATIDVDGNSGFQLKVNL